jgi:virginiamycin B lyase
MDGNLWFTEGSGGSTNQIGRISTAGTITEFPIPNTTALFGLTNGGDGNLWIADFFTIIKMSAGGNFQQFAVSNANEIFGVAFGSDKNVWLTNLIANTVVKLNLH